MLYLRVEERRCRPTKLNNYWLKHKIFIFFKKAYKINNPIGEVKKKILLFKIMKMNEITTVN